MVQNGTLILDIKKTQLSNISIHKVSEVVT